MARKDEKSTAVKRPNFIRRYIQETLGELRKVTWPTRREATNLTVIVLAVTLTVGMYLGLMDFIISRLFALLFV